jgi:hypothetical protein
MNETMIYELRKNLSQLPPSIRFTVISTMIETLGELYHETTEEIMAEIEKGLALIKKFENKEGKE